MEIIEAIPPIPLQKEEALPLPIAEPVQYSEQTGWYDFWSPGPDQGCSHIHENIVWIHKDCGGHTKISADAEVVCMGCGAMHGVLSWGYSCSNNGHTLEIKQPNNSNLSLALTIPVLVASKKGDRAWAHRLINRLLLLSLRVP